jgi:putative phage-type endonuclease
MNALPSQLIVEKVDPDQRAAWLAARRKLMTGSKAPAALRVAGSYMSALQVWAEMTGKIQPDDIGDREYVEWGNILEEPIAQKYVKITGRPLIDHGRFALRINPDRPWQGCTIDRELPLPFLAVLGVVEVPYPTYTKGTPGSLSIKNAGEYRKKDWEEEPPIVHQVQFQHELSVLGWAWGSFAVLIGGNKFHWMDRPRNDRFISYLVEREEEFMDLVLRDIPPDPDASDSTKEVLLRLYPRDTGESIVLPEKAAEWAERRRALKDQEKAISEELQGIDNQIKAAIGQATIGLLPDGSGFSWKSQHRDSYTVAATDFRVLREIKPKGRK